MLLFFQCFKVFDKIFSVIIILKIRKRELTCPSKITLNRIKKKINMDMD